MWDSVVRVRWWWLVVESYHEQLDAQVIKVGWRWKGKDKLDLHLSLTLYIQVSGLQRLLYSDSLHHLNTPP